MDNIEYKMLELLVYKHVIVHLSMSKDATSLFFFHRAHKKVQNACHIQLKTFLKQQQTSQ